MNPIKNKRFHSDENLSFDLRQNNEYEGLINLLFENFEGNFKYKYKLLNFILNSTNTELKIIFTSIFKYYFGAKEVNENINNFIENSLFLCQKMQVFKEFAYNKGEMIKQKIFEIKNQGKNENQKNILFLLHLINEFNIVLPKLNIENNDFDKFFYSIEHYPRKELYQFLAIFNILNFKIDFPWIQVI